MTCSRDGGGDDSFHWALAFCCLLLFFSLIAGMWLVAAFLAALVFLGVLAILP